MTVGGHPMSEPTDKRLEIALKIAEATGLTIDEADALAEKSVRALVLHFPSSPTIGRVSDESV